jgi:hypothetical protein
MNAKRSAFTRGRIAVVDRVDAVVAAMRIAQEFAESRRRGHHVHENLPWAIIAEIKAPAVDRSLIRKWTDEILGVRLEPPYLIGYLRLRVADLEAACGLPPDERTVAAVLARGGPIGAWDAYLKGIEAEPQPIETPIPTTTEAGHAHARS